MPPLRLLAVFTAFAAGACASVAPPDCASGDWRAMGRADGAAGRSLAMLAPRRNACGAPNETQRAAYLAGREEGLRLYCDPEGALEKGRGGKPYAGLCADAPETAVEDYRVGRRIRALEAEIADLRYILASADSHGFAGFPARWIGGGDIGHRWGWRRGRLGFGRRAWLRGRILDLKAELRSLEKLAAN